MKTLGLKLFCHALLQPCCSSLFLEVLTFLSQIFFQLNIDCHKEKQNQGSGGLDPE